jgi:hypothetical protein
MLTAASGRKNRVVISCVTFETVKIIEPIAHYQATRVHLLWYTRDPDNERGKIYSKFYENVHDACRNIYSVEKIEGHNERVSDFTTMLSTVLGIIRKEREEDPLCDIYVNISAGTSEYAAAAAIASMMASGKETSSTGTTVPFSVATKRYTVPVEMIPEIYFDKDKNTPIGLTKEVYDPIKMPCYHIEMPERHLILALRIFRDRKKAKLPVTNTKMISELEKDEAIWFHGETYIGKRGEDSDKERRSKAVYYQRNFIDKWKDKGWIRKDETTKKYAVTELGETILNTFYK